MNITGPVEDLADGSQMDIQNIIHADWTTWERALITIQG
jgi:hypothetical protein